MLPASPCTVNFNELHCIALHSTPLYFIYEAFVVIGDLGLGFCKLLSQRIGKVYRSLEGLGLDLTMLSLFSMQSMQKSPYSSSPITTKAS